MRDAAADHKGQPGSTRATLALEHDSDADCLSWECAHETAPDVVTAGVGVADELKEAS